MSVRARDALLALLADETLLREAERTVRALLPDPPQLDEMTRLRSVAACCSEAEIGLALARNWYADVVMEGIDRVGPARAANNFATYVAYLAAALAARAGRLQESGRWLVVAHVEAEADGLGVAEVHYFVSAVRAVHRSGD